MLDRKETLVKPWWSPLLLDSACLPMLLRSNLMLNNFFLALLENGSPKEPASKRRQLETTRSSMSSKVAASSCLASLFRLFLGFFIAQPTKHFNKPEITILSILKDRRRAFFPGNFTEKEVDKGWCRPIASDGVLAAKSVRSCIVLLKLSYNEIVKSAYIKYIHLSRVCTLKK